MFLPHYVDSQPFLGFGNQHPQNVHFCLPLFTFFRVETLRRTSPAERTERHLYASIAAGLNPFPFAVITLYYSGILDLKCHRSYTQPKKWFLIFRHTPPFILSSLLCSLFCEIKRKERFGDATERKRPLAKCAAPGSCLSAPRYLTL